MRRKGPDSCEQSGRLDRAAWRALEPSNYWEFKHGDGMAMTLANPFE